MATNNNDVERDWVRLPVLLLEQIAEKLPVLDFLRFISVCSSWSSAAAFCDPSARQHPWLMVPSPGGDHSNSLFFLSFPESRLIRLPNNPELTNHRVFGSYNGWLLTVSLQLEVSLFNPLTRARLQLPPLTTHPNVTELLQVFTANDVRGMFIDKAIVGGTSSGNDCVVVLIVDRCLTFARPGDNSWSPPTEPVSACGDAVLVGRKLWILGGEDGVQTLDLDTPDAKPKLLIESRPHPLHEGTYLAVSSDGKDVIHVRRFLKAAASLPDKEAFLKTRNFDVQRFDWRAHCWVPVHDLKGMSLFLGGEQTTLFSVRDLPGLRENCIYYTDDLVASYGLDAYSLLVPDVGVFDLEKKTFEDLYPAHAFRARPPPVWFTPSLSPKLVQ